MAERALPPGAIRRRAMFGLLDADGWTWAFLKALFWFLLVIFMLGYVPDRLYYFTVANTVDFGYNAVPLVNFCDASNEDLPCPAPVGAVVPWQSSPPELALPEARVGAVAVQSGTNLYLVGGEGPNGAVADTLATQVTIDGNFAPWVEGPALPEPRSDAAIATLAGVPYVVGGLDAEGAPTTTVFEGTLENGVLTGWTALDGTDGADLTLPVALSGATAVGAPGGVWVFGGRTAEGLSATVYRSRLSNTTPPSLGAWEEVGHLPLLEPRADAVAVAVGTNIYVMGGEGPQGVTQSVYRLGLGADGEPRTDPATEQPLGWAVPVDASGMLPEPRAGGRGFSANGVLYYTGGVDANGTPQATNYYSVPVPATGDISSWSELGQSNLPDGRAGAAVTNVGSFAFVIGGESSAGPATDSFRANLSPKLPFFRAGLFGVTIPALSIKGEIGQQLGYLNAFGVGMTNFVILLAIGWAFSHRAQTMRLIERFSRGRFRAPREDEYFPERR